MTYTHVDQTPSVYQWDPSSRLPLPDWGNAGANCGPTCVTWVANFYRNASFGINATRTLSGAPNYVGTSIAQQRTMLAKRGVPCYAAQPSVTQMRDLVASGRRPIIVGLYMARVPSAMRGHPFTGMHSVVLRKTRTLNGVRGFDVLDPNFSKKTGRIDPTNGHRFYSEAVVAWAFYEATIRGRSWALIPTNPKAVTAPAPTTAYVKFNAGVNGVNLRSGPTSLVNNIYATAWSDADPKPNGIIRRSDGKWIGNTNARRTLYATVRGNDGHVYYRIRMKGTNANQYIQTRFMHRVT
jgi:hypothetical protein